MFQRMAHRLAGDLDQSAERLVQFEEQEDRSAYGHRRRHERRNRGAVARREEAEAEEKDREPEYHYDQSGLEMAVPACSKRSQYIWPSSTVVCKAWDFAARCASVCGDSFWMA